MTVLQADLTWTGTRFERDVQVRVEDGRVAEVGALGAAPDERLAGRALLPGFVNAHSHAFQRALRGRGETFPEGRGSFWAWREAMYGLVASLTWKQFKAVCVGAFREMRAAGITTVGEFHYLHHLREDDYALDELVVEAAAEAGIRLVLLNAYYNTGGIGQPLEGAQLRFRSKSVDAYWKQMDRLAARAGDGDAFRLGAVVHSVRAASRGDIAVLHKEAKRRGLVFHMHVEEQVREVEQCVAAYGLRPVQLVFEIGELDADTTLVHCTHTDPDDLATLRGCRARVCVCPLTEANLGDGLPALDARDAPCLGTDSNARLSMLEEMRWLEYGQRLRRHERGVLRDDAGGVAPGLLRAATETGARALGIEAGRIEAGRHADFVAVNLAAPALAGWTEDTLAEALVFGAGDEAIAATCVGGRWTPREGQEQE